MTTMFSPVRIIIIIKRIFARNKSEQSSVFARAEDAWKKQRKKCMKLSIVRVQHSMSCTNQSQIKVQSTLQQIIRLELKVVT